MDELNIVDTEPTSSSMSFVGINDLPDEVLEYILSLLPPYKDLEQCKLVCKRWKKNVSNVIQYTKTRMLRSLANFDVKWENVQVQQNANSGKATEQVQVITKRYSHSACFHENAMYVFGGCTCTSTTFNDLWKLDLSTRKWHRQLTTGSYPSPKACATLTYHDGSLLLFGGWTHPSPYPLHQAWRTFNELHIYDIATNRWNPVTTPTNSPPPMAGHSATIHKDNMVIFGGLHGQNNGSSNDVWCFNLYAHVWTKQEISGVRPQSRYGQSQIVLDDNHLLILGGCSQGNMNLNDIWLLNMSEAVWTWRQVTVRNPQWAASHLWCHPACRVGHYVVVFSRNPVTLAPIFSYSKWRPSIQTRSLGNSFERDPTIPPAVRRASESMVEQHVIDRDVNVNGRRGSLSVRTPQQPEANQLSLENQSLPSTYRSSASSVNPSEPSSSSSTFSNVIENNPVSVLNTSDESSDQEIAASSSSSAREGLNHSSIRQNSNDAAKFDSSRNVNVSNDRNSFNYNRFHSLSNNRRLEFLSPPHCSPGMAAFRDNSTVNANTGKQRERQLEALRRIEERLRNKSKEKNPPPAAPPSFSAPAPPPAASPSSPSGKRDTKPQSSSTYVKLLSPKMAMFVLDISCVLTDECFVSWLPVKSIAEDSPDDMILYTLVPGNGELIMFGGIQKDAMSINQQAQSSVNITNIVSNSVHFITPPHSII